jgi:hypothetical protein
LLLSIQLPFPYRLESTSRRQYNDPSPGKLLDLEMLVIASGKERTEAEYAGLLAGTGWRLTRIVPTEAPTSVIEGEAV